METMSLNGIEIGEEDMYRLMKEQALTFVADLFINLQDQEISMHDEIAKSKKPLIQGSRPSWTGPSDRPGIAWWARASAVRSATSTNTSFSST